MTYDRTLIVIRERSFLDLIDLTMLVIRDRPLTLGLTALVGIAPWAALNAALLRDPEFPLYTWLALLALTDVDQVDTIFHTAALIELMGGRSVTEEYRRRSFDVNVGGTENLVDAAQKAGVKRFVYTSSNSVVIAFVFEAIMKRVSPSGFSVPPSSLTPNPSAKTTLPSWTKPTPTPGTPSTFCPCSTKRPNSAMRA